MPIFETFKISCLMGKHHTRDVWRNLFETIIDTPQRYKTWQHSGFNHTRVKQKFPRRPEELNEVPGAEEETKSHLH